MDSSTPIDHRTRLSPDTLRAGLHAALIGAVALLLGVAIVAPQNIWMVPVAIVAIIATGALALRPVWGIYASIAAFVFAMNKADGLQANQMAYAAFAYLMLGRWYLWRLTQPSALLRGSIDRVVAVLLVVGLPVAILTGLILGADILYMRGEVISYTMVAFYFPVKEIVRSERNGPAIILSLIIFIALAVAIRNALSFQQIIASATQAWEIADARPGQGRGMNLMETQLMAGAIAALILILHTPRLLWKILFLALVAIFVFSLIMTRSRGYWVAFIFGIAVTFVFLKRSHKWHLLILSFTGGLVTFGSIYILLGPVMTDLVLGGTVHRFSTLDTAASKDVSLVNRFAESASAINKGQYSPILGWGLGSYFYHFDMTRFQTERDFFIHNGYVALWFKHGLWGPVLIFYIWGGSIVLSLRTYVKSSLPSMQRAIAIIAAAFLIAIIPSTLTSNPFPIRDQMFFFSMFTGLAIGLHQLANSGSVPVTTAQSS